jgi:KDO2-lipid IV(A) lauroyltransferase
LSTGDGVASGARRAPLGIRLAFAVGPRLPRRFALGAADLVGTVASLLAPRRRAVRANLRHALGVDVSEAHVRRVASQIFRTQARNYADLLHLPSLDRDAVARLVHLEGEGDLAAALAAGRGAILVSGHFANLDVVAQRIAWLGHPIVAVAERVEPPELLELLTERRGMGGMRLVPTDQAGGEVLRTLRDGGVVYLSADLDVAGGGTTARFFDAQARVPDGYARLALRRGTPLFFARVRRNEDLTFACILEPVPIPVPTGDRTRDIGAIVARALGILEAQIRADPGQWVMFRAMWDDA